MPAWLCPGLVVVVSIFTSLDVATVWVVISNESLILGVTKTAPTTETISCHNYPHLIYSCVIVEEILYIISREG